MLLDLRVTVDVPDGVTVGQITRQALALLAGRSAAPLVPIDGVDVSLHRREDDEQDQEGGA